MKDWIVRNILYRWFKPWMEVKMTVKFSDNIFEKNANKIIFAIGTDGMMWKDRELGFVHNTFKGEVVDCRFATGQGTEILIERIEEMCPEMKR
jgi:hypothetical protein